MKILVVDDQIDKIKKIIESINELKIPDIQIEHAIEAIEAKRKMQNAYYDVLILDIMLPDRIDSTIREDGGIRLMSEVRKKSKYKYPGIIVGITSDKEIVNKYKGEFFSLIYYDVAEIDWKKDLQNYIKLATDTVVRLANRGEIDYNYDIGIVCALDERELTPVRHVFDLSIEHINDSDGVVYYEGIINVNGNEHKVVATSCDSMGLTSASVTSMKLIEKYRPKYLFMTGICAGVKGKVDIGDIIVADPIWNYGNGKYVSVDGEIKFLSDPQQLRLNVDLARKIDGLAMDKEIFKKIRSEYITHSKSIPQNDLKCFRGPFASGEAVLASRDKIDDVRTQSRNLLGIDMESYAVHFCSQYSTRMNPISLTIKSVCDFGDEDKGDNYQEYAAFTSAKFLRMIIESLF